MAIYFSGKIIIKLKNESHDNLFRRNARVAKLWSFDKTYSGDKYFIDDVLDLSFSNIVLLRRPRVASFVGIIKIAIAMNKATFKNSLLFKRITNYVLKDNFYISSSIKTKLLISSGKWLCQQNVKGVSQDS